MDMYRAVQKGVPFAVVVIIRWRAPFTPFWSVLRTLPCRVEAKIVCLEVEVNTMHISGVRLGRPVRRCQSAGRRLMVTHRAGVWSCDESARATWPNRRRLLDVTSCAGGRHNMPPPTASWPLTFWPWKWCPSHVWRGLPPYQFRSSYGPLCSRLRPDVRDRQTDSRRSSSLNAPYPSGGGIIREVTGGWPVLQLTSYIGEMSGVRDMPRLRRVRRDVGDLVWCIWSQLIKCIKTPTGDWGYTPHVCIMHQNGSI